MAVVGEGKAPLSFAAVAEKKAEKPSLRCVQLDGHVVLKIAKHCRDNMPNLVTGQLLGLDVGPVLEVTDCFPFPVTPVREMRFHFLLDVFC
jgi:translation initiation factor 3 subunit H